MPVLSESDLAFLRDGRTWMSGPTYDLWITYPVAGQAEAARDALFSVPSILGPFAEPADIPRPSGYQTMDEESGWAWAAYIVVRDPRQRLAPFGALSYYVDAEKEQTFNLAVYAPHYARACGIGPLLDTCVRPGWLSSRVIAFHGMLLDVARHICARCPYRRAWINDETVVGWPSSFEGIAVDRELAGVAGWKVAKCIHWAAILPFE